MLTVAVCDDSQPFLQVLCKKIRCFFQNLQVGIDDQYFLMGKDILRQIEYGKRYDIVFLDIEMPGSSGFDVAKTIREKLPNCLIIFLTSHSEYSIDAYELSVFRYIPKCELDQRLQHALTDALQVLRIEENESYIFKSLNHGLIRIPYKEIVFVNKANRNSYFHLLSKEVYAQRKSLKIVYQELSSEDFLLIDRGYIVNILHIMRLENGYAVCRDGTHIKISRPNLPIVQDELCKYWGSNI